MKLYNLDDILKEKISLNAVALGSFDAIHNGHQELLNKTIKLGRGNSGVITFKENPSNILDRKNYHGNILTLEQKIHLFEKMGFNYLILIDFSTEFSKISGEAFVNKLISISSLQYVIVGEDYKCGYKGHMSVSQIKPLLKHYKIRLIVCHLKKINGRKVSSSDIRNHIVEGSLDVVIQLLGRPYEIELPSDLKCGEYLHDYFNQLLPGNGSYCFIDKYGKAGKLDINLENVRLHGYKGTVKDSILLTTKTKEIGNGY